MEILSFISQTIHDVAWPLVVLLALRRFDSSVVELLKRLIEVRFPSKVNFKFESPQKMAATLLKANQRPTPPLVNITNPKERPIKGSTPQSLLTDQQKIPMSVMEEPSVEIPYDQSDEPRLAMQIAWVLLCERLLLAVKEEGGAPSRSPVTAAEYLAKRLSLPAHFSATVVKLQLMLKQYRDSDPTQNTAKEFVDACNAVLSSLVQPDDLDI
jgi:hypothetical protein